MPNNQLISTLCFLGSFACMLREENHIAGENFCKRHKISIAAKKGEHDRHLLINREQEWPDHCFSCYPIFATQTLMACSTRRLNGVSAPRGILGPGRLALGVLQHLLDVRRSQKVRT